MSQARPGGVPGPLHTDLYQLTMAQAYWHAGITGTEACFHMLFRANPFGGGYAIACGLEQAFEYLESFAFTRDDLDYLSGVPGADGEPVFDPAFLRWLSTMDLTCDVDAVREGTVVFAGEPLIRVTGPMAQSQVIETALLNMVNFQTLIATKAARVCLSAGGDPVVEFGLRRAQGPDGGLSASRAAYVGGCVSTSNVLAGRHYGIPVAGTHAHSWVMAFDSEIEAFGAYVDAMPNNATLLVDTYDTLEGVRHAVEAGQRLRERGFDLAGIRIDSGDLAWLSVRARRILDDAGFTNTRIVASNELDESLIASLKEQGAAIDVWGVGTKLATAWDQPALGGIYKLSAIRRPGEDWVARIKVSDQLAKMTIPGLPAVRRFRQDGRMSGDMVYDVRNPPSSESLMVDPSDPTRRKSFEPDAPSEDILEPAFRGGKRVCSSPPIAEVRGRALSQLSELDPTVRRLVNPHTYPVGLEHSLHETRTRLVYQARGLDPRDGVLHIGGQPFEPLA